MTTSQALFTRPRRLARALIAGVPILSLFLTVPLADAALAEGGLANVWRNYHAFAKYPFVQSYPKFERRIKLLSAQREAGRKGKPPTGWINYRFYFNDGVLVFDGEDNEGSSCSFQRKGMSLREASQIASALTHGREPGGKTPLKPFDPSHLKWEKTSNHDAAGWFVAATKSPDGLIESVDIASWGQ